LFSDWNTPASGQLTSDTSSILSLSKVNATVEPEIPSLNPTYFAVITFSVAVSPSAIDNSIPRVTAGAVGYGVAVGYDGASVSGASVTAGVSVGLNVGLATAGAGVSVAVGAIVDGASVDGASVDGASVATTDGLTITYVFGNKSTPSSPSPYNVIAPASASLPDTVDAAPSETIIVSVGSSLSVTLNVAITESAVF
jgi:hypothetical protein